ncbi:Putative fluoride ion transporter CrcB [Nocardioides dokdonensis FR1436]|uniref:Fluoride-specific ion channel FluC n=1 Tax=Nocardioides dokdonensis FR1436 TaxID=1300347 RepID=A0A1A9GIM5_9ACTN|nr:CrcB family protein [Nocardioides dokdonensis]ANH37305.1 Putative fluoride ion transporter CrcB [Nocardioides dokdonensis FR1436]
MTLLLVGVGGAVGAALRWWLGVRLDGVRLPLGTLLANLAGSLLLGLFVGLALRGHALALLGTGFCGALSTYSSFAVQAHDRGRRAAAYVVVTVLGSLLLCTLGFVVGAGR